jgi:hypothetical protein
VAKGILNISNYSGGLNNKTNSRDIEDNQFQNLDSLSIETPGKLKVMGAVDDYVVSLSYTGYKMSNVNNSLTASSSDTDFTITAYPIPPAFAVNNVIRINNEDMLITAAVVVASAVNITVTRGYNSTTIAAHERDDIYFYNSIGADTATNVKYGNGIFHFNADYDIDDISAVVENNEMLFVNTDSGTNNAPVIKPFKLNSNKLGYSSRTDITYGNTWSEIDYNAVDGTVRITPKDFTETNKPIKLEYINENYYMGADTSSSLFTDTGFTLESSVIQGSTSATTTSNNESSDFAVGDIVKFEITVGNFTFTSSTVTLTGVTPTEIQFAAFGGQSLYASGSKVLKASGEYDILQSEIGWKKIDTELPEVTENEVKVWNLNSFASFFSTDSGADVTDISRQTNPPTLTVSDGSIFKAGDLILCNGEYIHVVSVSSNTLEVDFQVWGTASPGAQVGDDIKFVHYTSWGEVHSVPVTQDNINPFYVVDGVGADSSRGAINIAFWVGSRPYTNSNIIPDDNTGTFFTSTDSLVNIFSEVVYLDNQRSPLKFETRLESSKVNQSVHASIWGKVPNKSNIKSVKLYYNEVKSNYSLDDTTQTSPGEDYNKNKIKYLLFEIDFRKGIRYAGGDEYYNADPVIHTTSGKSIYVYPQTSQSLLYGVAGTISDAHIILGNIDLKDKPENVSAEPYIDVDTYIMGAYGTGYKTSTVANRRLYIGNVNYTDPITKDLKRANDTIFKSNLNAFDTFTFENRIDVEINDGDDIIALESLGSKLLEFKRNHLYIINIARDIEFLEATLEYKGCEKDYHVLRGEGFIAWFNKFGFYLYDGKQIRDLLLDKNGQQRVVWDNYYDVNNVIGFDPEEKTIVIINKNQKIIAFDMKATALYFRSKGAATNDITNIVTTNAGKLIYLEKYNSTNVKLRKYNIAPSQLDSSQINEMALKTKEYTFGKPSVDKKIISVYLSYKNGDGVELYGFRNDGEEELLAALDGNSETAFKTLHIPIRKAKTEFVDKKRFDRIKGFGLRFSGSNVATDFEVNDIQIIFREKSVK